TVSAPTAPLTEHVRRWSRRSAAGVAALSTELRITGCRPRLTRQTSAGDLIVDQRDATGRVIGHVAYRRLPLGGLECRLQRRAVIEIKLGDTEVRRVAAEPAHRE